MYATATGGPVLIGPVQSGFTLFSGPIDRTFKHYQLQGKILSNHLHQWREKKMFSREALLGVTADHAWEPPAPQAVNEIEGLDTDLYCEGVPIREIKSYWEESEDKVLSGVRGMVRIGIGVANPHPYPAKPIPLVRGTGFYGILLTGHLLADDQFQP